jgi:MOSC domain-containing protein YiiM
MAVLVSIQVGMPQKRGDEGATDPMDRPWTSGFVKDPVHGPVHVGQEHLEGDGQADLRVHGGVDKAILAYSAGHYFAWRDELLMPDLPHGAFGENFTIDGLDETAVCIGDVWQLGNVRVEVSQPRQPCWKLARRWRRADLPQRVLETGRSGWYFRVLREGRVGAGEKLELIVRPYPRWTITAVTKVLLHDRDDRRAAADLAQVAALPEGWRNALLRRAVESRTE